MPVTGTEMRRGFAVLCLLVLSGCALSSPRTAFTPLAETVSDRTGQMLVWRRDEESAKAIAAEVDRLLEASLSVDSVVRVALLNGPEVQATFAELGIAQAEFAEAVLPGPFVIGAETRVPRARGARSFEFSLALELLDLLLLPHRIELADSELEMARAKAAAAVIGRIGAARRAFIAHQAAAQRLELLEQAARATGAAQETAQALHEAGNITDFALARESLLDAETRLRLSEAEIAVAETRERLNVLIGLWGKRTAWTAPGRLPEPDGAAVPEAPAVERQAVEANLALRAALERLRASAAADDIALPRSILQEVEGEAVVEREGNDRHWKNGGGVFVTIPLLDLGGAYRAKASATLLRDHERFLDLAIRVRATARRTALRLAHATDAARHYRATVLRLGQDVFGAAQLEYNAMQRGVFDLLSIKRERIAQGLAYVDALEAHALARVDLDELLAGGMPDPAATMRIAAPSLGAAEGGH